MVLSLSSPGPEFLVNQFTTGGQQYAKVASDASGNFVVAWVSYGQTNAGDIYARRFNSNGVALGNEFRVNTYTTNDQYQPVIAMNASGQFVIAWSSKTQDGNGEGVYAQRYNANGTVNGSEFRVNNYTRFNQNTPTVAMDNSGNFVVAWQSGTTSDNVFFDIPQEGFAGVYGVYARRYTGGGATAGSEFQVNTYTTGYQGGPAVAMDADGDFVVVWTTYDQPGDTDAGLMARRYNNAGTAQGGEFRINNSTAGQQFFPSVGMNSTGAFVVAWGSDHEDLVTNRTNTYARRYDNAGNALASEFRVNTYTPGEQFLTTVAVDATGNFIVVWSSGVTDTGQPLSLQQDGNGYGVYAQAYNSVGGTIGAEFRVNNVTTGNQFFPTVALDASSNAVIAYSSAGQDGSGYGNYARLYKVNQNPIANAGGPYSVTEGQSATFNASGSSDPNTWQTLSYFWDINGDNIFTDATGVSPTLTWAQLQALVINDGPSSKNVRVAVDDGAGGVTISSATTLSVINAPPVAGINGASFAVRGEPLTYSLYATDPSAADQVAGFTFSIDWDGDTIVDQVVNGPNASNVVHTYTNDGVYTIRMTATDKDGGVSAVVTHNVTVNKWTVRPDDVNPLLSNLVIGGSTGDDFYSFWGIPGPSAIGIITTDLGILEVYGVTGQIHLYMQAGADSVTINAGVSGKTFTVDAGEGFNIMAPLLGSGNTFTYTGGSGVDQFFLVAGPNNVVTFNGGGGDDVFLDVSGYSSNTVTVNGGEGNDGAATGAGVSTLNGDNGNDMMVSFGGSTTITGGAGDDFLVGGGGPANIDGGANNDLVVAGSLVFLPEATDGYVPIWTEWGFSGNSFATRKSNIETGATTGGYTITDGSTAFDNGVVDTILGGTEEDWLVYKWSQDSAADYSIGTDVRTNLA